MANIPVMVQELHQFWAGSSFGADRGSNRRPINSFSIRTAERYMCAALFLKDKYDTVSHLQPSTIYRLSAKTMPPSTAERVLARLTKEPALSDIDVNALIDQFLPVKEPVPIAPFQESTSSPLIKAWKEASPSDRNALLDSDREAIVRGA